MAAGDALLEALRMFFDLNEWCGLWECARVTGYDAERMTIRVERKYVAEEGVGYKKEPIINYNRIE